jgi:Zn-dependent protease with chaperone function
MIEAFLNWPALPALIALLPALLSWWSGRRLATLADDPALPERLHASRRVHGMILVASFMGLATIATDSLFWSLPLLFISVMAAGYPLRKVLHGETWSLAAYLSFFVRLAFMWLGFWTALATLPAIAALGGTSDWAIALVVGWLLVYFNHRFADVVRRSLRTTPLEDGPLLTRCRALADKCTMPAVRFERIDLNGGVIANALALPSLHGSSVLFSSTLIDRLEEDEAVAICAHELAHLEYYDTRRLRKLNLVNHAAIALAILFAPVSRLAGVESALPTTAVWLCLIVMTLVVRAKDKQRLETAADVRAIELTGQPEALVSALTKLYIIARIPRRIERQREQADTHPSLARRIRDIRSAAGNAPAPLATTSTFASSNGRTVVTFADAAVEWTEGTAVTHRLNYASLTEIRIDARGSTTPRLVVRGSEPGHRWEMPLAPSDVASAQALLDIVDARLGDARPARRAPFPLHRTVVACAMTLTYGVGHFAAAFVMLLALWRPAPQLLFASGLAALGAAGLALRGSDILTAAVAPIVAVVGIALLWLAYRSRHDEEFPPQRAIAALSAAALLAFAMVLVNGVDAVHLHQSTVTATAAPVFLVALAGALATLRTRRAQVATVAATLAATVIVVAASPAFLDAFARDPFLVAAAPVQWVQTTPTILDEFDVPTATSRVLFSPDGRHVATLQHAESDDEEASTFQVGRVGGNTSPLDAHDLVFADNDHLLVLTADDGGTRLKQVPVSALNETVWQQYLRDVRGASLSFDPATARWTVTGWNHQRGITRVSGRLGEQAIDRHQWPAHHTQRAYVSGLITSGNNAVVVETRYHGGLSEGFVPARWRWLLMLGGYNQESQFWLVGDRDRRDIGSSRLGAKCNAGITERDALLCTVYDGTRTRLLTIDAATGTIEPIAFVDGRFFPDDNAVKGWLTGWADSRLVAIHLATKRAFTPPAGEKMVTTFAPSQDRLAVVVFGQHHSTVRRYAME